MLSKESVSMYKIVYHHPRLLDECEAVDAVVNLEIVEMIKNQITHTAIVCKKNYIKPAALSIIHHHHDKEYKKLTHNIEATKSFSNYYCLWTTN